MDRGRGAAAPVNKKARTEADEEEAKRKRALLMSGLIARSSTTTGPRVMPTKAIPQPTTPPSPASLKSTPEKKGEEDATPTHGEEGEGATPTSDDGDARRRQEEEEAEAAEHEARERQRAQEEEEERERQRQQERVRGGKKTSLDTPSSTHSPYTVSSPKVAEPAELVTYFPAQLGCRSMGEYERINRVEEGTYGVVYRVRDNKTGEIFAAKRLKMEREKDGFPITSLREINTLLKAKHENIVNVREIIVGETMADIAIVMEFVEHDLKSLLEDMKQPLLIPEVKTLMHQLLSGVHHLHDNWILHRDLKTSNLLLSHRGILKIADFGLAREYGSPIKPYTPLVVTLWYRCPELLLGEKVYSTEVDMWSVGCIFAELLTKKPLFPGQGEIDTLKKIFTLLGTPTADIWEGFEDLPTVKKLSFATLRPMVKREFGKILTTDMGMDLFLGLLTYDPKKRLSAEDALSHAWFEEYPRPTDPDLFPHWPARAEGGGAAARNRPASPTAPRGAKPSEEEELEAIMAENASRNAEFTLRF